MEIDWLLEEFKLGFHPGLLPGLKSEVCLSVNPEAEVVDAFGNIFDCTEVPYVPAYEGSEYLLGNINNHPDTISKNRTLLNFNDEILSGSLPCSTCEMLPVCGGACPKSWKENVAPCPANKFNIKDKLKLHYAIKKKGKDKVLAVIN
jgi:uncharacterized protein